MGKRSALQTIDAGAANIHDAQKVVKKAKAGAADAKKLRAPSNTFDNPERIAMLHAEITSEKPLEKIHEGMAKVMQQKVGDGNKDRLKKLLAGRPEELSDDVSLYTYPGGTEVIAKSFAWTGEFAGAFQEIAGGICTTQLVNTGECPNFCRMYDVFIAKDTLFMLFERLVGDIEKEFNDNDEREQNLEDPFTMWDMLFQLSMAVTKMQKNFELVHFDIRHDNVQITWLDEPRQLYKMFPYKTNFIVKLIDFGQCEMKIGNSRPINEDVCHGEDQVAHWGTFPEEFCPGYDMQYFLYTLVDILQEHVSQYYILDAALTFVDSDLHTESNKTPQSRPLVVSKKSAKEVRDHLWKEVKDMAA